MLYITQLLFNKISSSHKYKETVSHCFKVLRLLQKTKQNPPKLAPDDLVMAYKDIR